MVIDLQYFKFNISFWELDMMEYDRIEKLLNRYLELQKEEKKRIAKQKNKTQ